MSKIAEFGDPAPEVEGESDEDTAARQEVLGMDRLVDAASICLENKIPEVCADRDKLEDILDMPTIYKVIEICGGIKLDDPNLLAAATATATSVTDGTI